VWKQRVGDGLRLDMYRFRAAGQIEEGIFVSGN
jgi:hypothetical protein